MSDLPALNIALRGHVRQSMSDRKLKDFLDTISESFQTNVFAHAWDVVQNSLSWRNVEEISDVVTEEMVSDYLSGLRLIGLKVESDKNLTHPGSILGCVGRTRCPVLGWKNMYRGKVEVCSMIEKSEPPESVTLQMRFDIFSNPYSPRANDVVRFVKRDYEHLRLELDKERIRFLHMHCFVGIDNMYMARNSDMLKFVSYMYYDMDRILVDHNQMHHQEHIAFHERMSWLNWSPSGGH